MDSSLTKYDIALLRGDGIGPELAHSANLLLEAISANSAAKFDIEKIDAGDEALSRLERRCRITR